MTSRIILGSVLLALASTVQAQVMDQAPPKSECLKLGDDVLLEGIVAERRVLLKSDNTRNTLYLFRTVPMCVYENEIKHKVDKFRLVATRNKAQYNAMSQVSGNNIRIVGKLIQVVDPMTAPYSIDVTSVTDLEAEGGPAQVEPEIPLSISFRDALISSGKVAQFKNRTKSPLAVTIEFYRPATEAKKTQDLVLNPEERREIGEREGWAFVKDDRITVSRKGMKTFTVIAP